MQRQKVIRIIDRLNIGGPAIHVSLLSAGLNNKKFETVLIAGNVCEHEGDMIYLAEKYDVRPVFLEELGREISLFRDFRALWKIYQIIRRERPKVVHTHKSKAGLLGRVAAFLAGVPVIIHTFHGHVFHSYFGKLKTHIFITLEKILARFTTKIITISSHQYQEICHIYRIAHGSRFTVVPLGFDFSPLEQREVHRGWLKNKYSVPDNHITVGIVGRLATVKNHCLFIEVAAKVLAKYKNVTFAIIGDGELKEVLQQQVEALQITGNVVFAGWIQDSAKIYSDLDIVALTSLNEGTPVTIIEAMFCHKPVVATNVGGVADLVQEGENGYLTPLNADVFAKALLKLINDSELRTVFGNKGRTMVKEKYSQQRLIADIENLYCQLIKRW